MPVINIPGVPPLLNASISFGGVTVLLTGDAPNLNAFNFAQQWGLFLGGSPAVVFDSFVSIEYKREWAISDYPIEQGGFESYNKVQVPFNVHVKFASGGSEENRAALEANCEAVAKTLDLYSVVTPERVYRSVNVQHIDYRRTSTNGVGLLTVEMWLLEVRTRVVEISTSSSGTATDQGTVTIGPVEVGSNPAPTGVFENGAAPLTNTQQPSGASVFNNGSVAPQPFTPPAFDPGNPGGAAGNTFAPE